MSDDIPQYVPEDPETERTRWRTRSRYVACTLVFCAAIITYYTLHDKEGTMHQGNLDSAWNVAALLLIFLIFGRSAEFVLSIWARKGSLVGSIMTGQPSVKMQSGGTSVEVKSGQTPPTPPGG